MLMTGGVVSGWVPVETTRLTALPLLMPLAAAGFWPLTLPGSIVLSVAAGVRRMMKIGTRPISSNVDSITLVLHLSITPGGVRFMKLTAGVYHGLLFGFQRSVSMFVALFLLYVKQTMKSERCRM